MQMKTVSFSFEPALIAVMDRRVLELDTDRSKYIRRLLREDLRGGARARAAPVVRPLPGAKGGDVAVAASSQ